MAEEKKPEDSKKEAEDLKSLNDERERENKLLAETKRLRESSLQLAQEELLELKAELDSLKDSNNIRQKGTKIKEKEQEIAKQELKVERELIKEQLKKKEIDAAGAQASLKRIKDKEKELKLDDETIEKNKEINKGLVVSIRNFLGLGEAMESIKPGGMIEVAKSLNKISTEIAQTGITMGDAYSGFFEGFTDLIGVSNKSLGVFVGQVADLEGGSKTLTQYGAGFKEINESMMGLRMSMAGFSDETISMQSYLAGNATKMKNLGVSAEEQGKSLNFLTKSLRMNGVEASETLNKLGRVAISAGIPVKNLLRDFGQIGPQLAAQGPKAIEIFSNLAKQAKSLGVEVSSLMSVFGSAMDTFEGAAAAAGKFNAVMGGDYLNAMQLLNATEDERVEIVKRQMDATGKNFATMSKYEKIAVANALGIKDVNEAQMILAGSTEEMRRKKEKEAATQEQLNKLQADAVDIATKLGSVFQVVYGAMLPFLEIIQKVANVLTMLNDKGKGIPGVIVVGLLMSRMLSLVTTKFRETTFEMIASSIASVRAAGGFGVAAKSLFSLANIKASAGSIFGAIIQLLPLIIMLFESLHDTLLVPHSPILIDTLNIVLPDAFESIGKAVEKVWKPMLAFGAAMLMVGGGVYLAAKGLADFVRSFGELNTEQLVVAGVALVGFGLAMSGVIFAMAGLATSGIGAIGIAIMLSFGAAVMMVGLGVKFAADGMASLISSMKELTLGQATTIAKSLKEISGGVSSLASSLMFFAAGGLFGMGPLAGLAMLAVSILAIGASLDKFPAEKSISFSTSMNSLTDALKEVKTTTDAEIQPTLKLVNAVKEYAIVKERTSEDDPLVKLLREIKGLLQKTAAAPAPVAGAQNIELKVDNDVLAKIIKKNAPNPLAGKAAANISYGG